MQLKYSVIKLADWYVITRTHPSNTHRHNYAVGRSLVVGFCGQSAS